MGGPLFHHAQVEASARAADCLHSAERIAEEAPDVGDARVGELRQAAAWITWAGDEIARLSAARPVLLGPRVFEFASFDQWVDGASRIWRLHQVAASNTVCVDKLGRICAWGAHFMRARDEKAFPVTVYHLHAEAVPNPEEITR